MAAIRLNSPAFDHDDPLPARHTSEGEGLSPPLAWTGVPPGTKELVIVCDNPDAEEGVFTHWVVYGLDPGVTELSEGVPLETLVEDPVPLVQGLNDFDESGYSPPTSSQDEGHRRIFFRLFALDTELDTPPGATRAELRSASKDHVLAQTELVGIT